MGIRQGAERMCNMRSCPFCGGKPYLERSSRAYIGGRSMKVAYVRCTECSARGPKIPIMKYGKTSHSVEAELEAEELWDRRNNDKADKRTV